MRLNVSLCLKKQPVSAMLSMATYRALQINASSEYNMILLCPCVLIGRQHGSIADTQAQRGLYTSKYMLNQVSL